MTNTFNNIRKWADKHDLNKVNDKQVIKVMEEAGELAEAHNKQHMNELRDAIGDIAIVITIIAYQHDWNVENLINEAYDVIKDRTGKNNNGTFIKEADLNE